MGSENRHLTFSQVQKIYQNTKRAILSFKASIFDPLGILTPFTLEPKLLIQELWSREIDWDEKNTVRFAIKMEEMATRLSKHNEGLCPKMVWISSNEQYQNKTFSVL